MELAERANQWVVDPEIHDARGHTQAQGGIDGVRKGNPFPGRPQLGVFVVMLLVVCLSAARVHGCDQFDEISHKEMDGNEQVQLQARLHIILPELGARELDEHAILHKVLNHQPQIADN